MLPELLTISEAESRTGLARSTIVRWLNLGRMRKRAQGKVALSDLERCIHEQRTGRPCRSGRSASRVTGLDYRTLAEKNMEPYCGTQGLQRLQRMLKALTWKQLDQHRDINKLRDVLINTLAETKAIEDRHAHFERIYGRSGEQ